MDYRRFQTVKWTPSKLGSALLIVDMQNYFKDISGSILPNIKRLLSFFRDKGLSVIYSQHTHKNIDEDGGLLVEWWGKESMRAFTPGRWEWEIMEEIKPKSNEVVIQKTRYSAFYKTDLEKILREKGITDLVICGVMTNYCCETTARDAFMRDFRVFFVADATSTDDPMLHMATLCNLASGFAVVMKTAEIIEKLSD